MIEFVAKPLTDRQRDEKQKEMGKRNVRFFTCLSIRTALRSTRVGRHNG
jgi:hypothetical protein